MSFNFKQKIKGAGAAFETNTYFNNGSQKLKIGNNQYLETTIIDYAKGIDFFGTTAQFTQTSVAAPTGYHFIPEKKYFLKAAIDKLNYRGGHITNSEDGDPNPYNIIVKLSNHEANSDEQIIAICNIWGKTGGDGGNYFFLEKIFCPKQEFTHIDFCIDRSQKDFSNDNLKNEKITFHIFENSDLENPKTYEIKSFKNLLDGNKKAKRLGIEGTPGLLMCINGQEIRIPPNGIFQIKSGYEIDFVGIAVQQESDYFIMNYEQED